jgi:alpha-tubulin suppressor-like RCC1 family protein
VVRPRLGRKDRNTNEYVALDIHPRLPELIRRPCSDAPDLASPHILRSLSAVKVVAVHGGSAACHFVARALDGSAYIFGRNTAGCLGTTGGAKAKKFQKKEDTPGADDTVSEHAPRRLTAAGLPGGASGQTIVHAACGRSHTLLVGSGGQVWAAGANAVGQVRKSFLH